MIKAFVLGMMVDMSLSIIGFVFDDRRIKQNWDRD